MAGTYYPSNDAEFSVWLANYLTVAAANLTELGLVAGDLTPISSLQPTFTTNINDVEAKKAALASAVDNKDATKHLVIRRLKVTVNKIQANPEVTPAMKLQLGITPRDGGNYPVAPITPSDLVAELMPDGSISLNWSRNGNAPTTQFVIEMQAGTATDWTLLNVITRTNYIHSGMPLGQQIKYVVKARRANETSGPSNIALVNASGIA